VTKWNTKFFFVSFCPHPYVISVRSWVNSNYFIWRNWITALRNWYAVEWTHLIKNTVCNNSPKISRIPRQNWILRSNSIQDIISCYNYSTNTLIGEIGELIICINTKWTNYASRSGSSNGLLYETEFVNSVVKFYCNFGDTKVSHRLTFHWNMWYAWLNKTLVMSGLIVYDNCLTSIKNLLVVCSSILSTTRFIRAVDL
jgi:hypothetical protein